MSDRGVSMYEGIHLAPMVRCNTIAMRVCALECGADLVWTEEIIDKKMAKYVCAHKHVCVCVCSGVV